MNYLSDFYEPDRYPPRVEILNGGLEKKILTVDSGMEYSWLPYSNQSPHIMIAHASYLIDGEYYEMFYDSTGTLYYWNENLDKLYNVSSPATILQEVIDKVFFKQQIQYFRFYELRQSILPVTLKCYQDLSSGLVYVEKNNNVISSVFDYWTDSDFGLADGDGDSNVNSDGSGNIGDYQLRFLSTGFLKRYYKSPVNNAIILDPYPLTNIPDALINDRSVVTRDDWSLYQKNPDLENTSLNFVRFCEEICIDNRYTLDINDQPGFVITYNSSKSEVVSCQWFTNLQLQPDIEGLRDGWLYQGIRKTRYISDPVIHYANGRIYNRKTDTFVFNSVDSSLYRGFYQYIDDSVALNNDDNNSLVAGIDCSHISRVEHSNIPDQWSLSVFFWCNSGKTQLDKPFIRINRKNDSYPILTLQVGLGGTLTVISGQERVYPSLFNVGFSEAGKYDINGDKNPTITLVRGSTYTFQNTVSVYHPLYIQTQGNGYSQDLSYNDGITGSGTSVVTFTVRQDSPDILYYQCLYHQSMYGMINIINPNYKMSFDCHKNICDNSWHHLFIHTKTRQHATVWIDQRIDSWCRIPDWISSNSSSSSSSSSNSGDSQVLECTIGNTELLDTYLDDFQFYTTDLDVQDTSYLLATRGLEYNDTEDFLERLANRLLVENKTPLLVTQRKDIVLEDTLLLDVRDTNRLYTRHRINLYESWITRRNVLEGDIIYLKTVLNQIWSMDKYHPLGWLYWCYQYQVLVQPFTSLAEIQSWINVADVDEVGDNMDQRAFRYYVYGDRKPVTVWTGEEYNFYRGVESYANSRNLTLGGAETAGNVVLGTGRGNKRGSFTLQNSTDPSGITLDNSFIFTTDTVPSWMSQVSPLPLSSNISSHYNFTSFAVRYQINSSDLSGNVYLVSKDFLS